MRIQYRLLLSLLFLPVAFAAQEPATAASPKSATPLTTAVSPVAGATYAVVVGISDYQDPDIPDLRFANRDAEAFANFLRSPGGGGLDGDHLNVLTNQQATAAQFAAALDALVEQCKAGDQAVIYFSGHGDVERKTISQPGFLLCWDAPARVYMGGGTYSLAYLEEIVRTLSVQNKARVLVIADACHAGKLAGSQIGGAQATTANLARQFANEIKILSCEPNEYSLEGTQWGGGRGCFSYHLIDGLFGLADRNEDGLVSLSEIDRYLEDHVAQEVAPQVQTPMFTGDKNACIARVEPQILANLQKFKSGQIATFAPTEGRGLEEVVLAGVDSSLRQKYHAFQKALSDKRFFEPADDCVEYWYAALSIEPGLSPLHGFLKRNYAAALQDDAQQEWNKLLMADIPLPYKSRYTVKAQYKPYPRYLERAAQLLGAQHYLYPILMARKQYFEARLARLSTGNNLNPQKGLKIIEALRNALALEPNAPHIYLEIGQTFGYQLNEPDSAGYYFAKAAEYAPSWVLPYTFFAEMLISRFKKFDLAIQALEAALRIDSNSVEAKTVMGIYYQNTNQLLEARQIFENLLEIHDSSINYIFIYINLGVNHYKSGNMKEAESMYKRAIAVDSTRAVGYQNLGGYYVNTGREQEAIPILLKGVEMDSTLKELPFNLGVAYSNLNRYSEAEQQYKRAIQLDSTYANAFHNLGLVYLNTGRSAKAQELFEKAIQLDTTDNLAHRLLGVLFQQAGRLSEAEAHYKEAIRLNPKFAVAYNDLGVVFINTNRFVEAEQQYRKAIELDSTFKFAYNNLGILYVDYLDRPAEAEQLFKKSIQIDPDYEDAYYNLGEAFRHLDRFAEAEQQYQKVVQLNPAAPDAWYNLAVCQTKQNRMDNAYEHLEQALKRGWTDSDLMQTDPDLAPLRILPKWKPLLKKYFPGQVKD